MSDLANLASIVITGSRHGIGRALSEHYLAHGHSVFGISRSPTDLAHERYRHFEADVCDSRRIQAALREIDAAQGLQVVINNAGVSLSRLALLTENEAATNALSTNVVGALTVMRESAKLMLRRGSGRIVNITSIESALTSPGAAVYAASKAALEKLTGAFAAEVSRADITVNAIGVSLFAGAGMARGLSEKALGEKVAQLIKPDQLKIEEIAHAIDFLASPLASNVTNQLLYFGGVR